MCASFGELFTTERVSKYEMVNEERQAESLAFLRLWRGFGGWCSPALQGLGVSEWVATWGSVDAGLSQAGGKVSGSLFGESKGVNGPVR